MVNNFNFASYYASQKNATLEKFEALNETYAE